MNRSVVAAAFLVAACMSPAGAQQLGLWQSRIGEGVAYGEPRNLEALSAADPVAALPIAPRPPARAVAPAARAAAPVKVEAPAPAIAARPASADLMNTYNPDLPLPHPDLEGFGPAKRVSTSPRPYVRGDEHGAVFGLTVPLAANRVPITSKATRSGAGVGGVDGGFGNR